MFAKPIENRSQNCFECSLVCSTSLWISFTQSMLVNDCLSSVLSRKSLMHSPTSCVVLFLCCSLGISWYWSFWQFWEFFYNDFGQSFLQQFFTTLFVNFMNSFWQSIVHILTFDNQTNVRSILSFHKWFICEIFTIFSRLILNN